MSGFGKMLAELGPGGDGDNKSAEKPPADQTIIDGIQRKGSSPMIRTNIRLITSAQTQDRADIILGELESAFNQFESTAGNSIVFKRQKANKKKTMLRSYIYREFRADQEIPLSLQEAATVLHFPAAGIQSSPQFAQAKSKEAPAPLILPTEGTLLGTNKFRNVKKDIYLTKEDRIRHFYVIGQTGTGKTVFLKNMIIQDMEQGEGVCFIDPHGEDIVDILSAVPEDRYDDVIYFDPGYTERVMAFNMLEYDERYPEQKTFVINEMFSIFKRLYGGIPESMGPMFEQYFRNATGLVVEDPSTGNTLLDIARIFADPDFRALKLSRSKNPVVNQFWEEIAARAQGDQSIHSIAPYITSKFDVFLANDIMRPIIGQEKSSFNFREVMDNRKILLVNLSKGRLCEINSILIGLIMVGKILMAALSRSGADQNLPPFYLYIDEFQNVTTDSISIILSEARKYKLSLTIAHQFISQLQDNTKNAVFGNVGSMAAFRVGSEDADFLEKHFHPVFKSTDLMNMDNYNAAVRLLMKGKPERPFNIATKAPLERNNQALDYLRNASYQKYGAPRAEVEKKVLDRYLKNLKAKPPGTE